MLKTTCRYALSVMGLLIVLSFTGPSTNVYAQAIDLAFMVNGSGSISAADFTTQKEGIKAALQNRDFFPLDGSVSFSLVQYANGITEVHIPYTVINTAADVNSLVAQVEAIVQIQGSTNPGDGIVTASNLLAAANNTSGQQVLCLSTDGITNSGVDLATAKATAENLGMDRLSVIAIEDPPNFTEPDYKAHYTPHVFGDGEVSVVSGSVEFANVVGLSCLGDPVELIGLEVVQAIQSWENTVQLIKGKETIVRAHVQTKDGNKAPASLRLRARDGNGNELAGSPRTASNAALFEAPPMAQNDQEIIDRRKQLSSSLNFSLPADWLSGEVEFEVESFGTPLDCQESADTDDDCKVTVEFQETAKPEVKFIKVAYTNAMGNVIEPTDPDITELGERLTAVYPIEDFTSIATGQYDAGSGLPNLTLLNMGLWLKRIGDGCISGLGCDHLYYGAISGTGLGGLAFLGGNVSSGMIRDVTYGHNRHAHEIAHNLSRDHAVFDITVLPPGKEGVCGESAGLFADDFPYRETVTGIGEIAPIGPLASGKESEIWGLDTNRDVAVDPRENFELMSYCGSGNMPAITPRWRWISDFTYDGVRDELNDRYGTVSPSSNTLLASNGEMQVAMSTQVLEDYLIMRGVVDLETETVEFLPFSVVAVPGQPDLPPTGDYILQLLDASDNVVSEFPFEPEEVHPDDPQEDPNQGVFLISTPADESVRRVNLLKDGEVMAERIASANAPEVQVVFPNGGENLSGTETTIEWMASDADGDDLSFLVQYSRDQGESWEVLAVDWPQQSFTVALKFLGETMEGLIRVTASDGFNTGRDESDGTFTTPNNVPDALILSPGDGEVFIGVEPVIFEASAFDVEDGELSGSSISWESSLDGALGDGELIEFRAEDLSEGEHTITLTVTDSAGATSVQTITILILRLPPIDTPPDMIDFEDEAPGSRLSEVFSIGGFGPVAVLGSIARCNANAATIYDTSCPTGRCSGGDFDLGTPNITFGGPGRGEAGEAGEPWENGVALGNVLIVHKECSELDELIEDPDVGPGRIRAELTFPAPVTLLNYTVLDVDGGERHWVRLYGEDGALLALF